MLKEFYSVSFLIIGFLFTFFISGSSITELFFPKLPARIKFPLYFILSLIVSTYVVYLVGFLIGFSRSSILISFSLFVPLFIYVLKDTKETIKSYIKMHTTALAGGICILILFFTSLYPAIFTRHGGSIVMASSNWQDTAMHTGIIESLTQGNFPPQAPYYAGVPLTYYYFTDFHSAILSTLYGKFFPRILVYDNPIFAFMFFLTLYSLSYELTKKKTMSVLSAATGSLFSSYMFIRFISDLIGNRGKLTLIKNIIQLLTDHSYSMEYEQLFQMSNMADYFLQNRPMMVGLPAATAVLVLIIYAFRKKSLKSILLAGIISGLLIKFQFFAVVVSVIIFGTGLLFHFKKRQIRFYLKSLFIFLLPILVCFLLFSVRTKVGETTLISLVKENFSFGVWDEGRSVFWHLMFIVGNFGFPFLVTIVTFFYFLVGLVRRKKVPQNIFFLSSLVVVFFIIPYSVRFTIYKGDMFKFFYFMAPLSVIVALWLGEKLIKNKHCFGIFLFLLVFTSSFSSILTLANSALNKNIAYSAAELKAGLWIRTNTSKNSVFISLPTVHTPISQIGGRLRVLSYINWPYSHGYNAGEDNVFVRLKDVENIYSLQSAEEVVKTAMKYKADYIYYGSEERAKAPLAGEFFDDLVFLKKVYSSEGVSIYEI